MDKSIIDVVCPKCKKVHKVVYGKILSITCECGQKIPIKKEENPEKKKR